MSGKIMLPKPAAARPPLVFQFPEAAMLAARAQPAHLPPHYKRDFRRDRGQTTVGAVNVL